MKNLRLLTEAKHDEQTNGEFYKCSYFSQKNPLEKNLQ